MTRNCRSSLSCGKASRGFPVIATAFGVAGCFGEALLQKHFALGRALQIALALVQAVPFGVLAQYLITSSPKTAERFNLRRGGVR